MDPSLDEDDKQSQSKLLSVSFMNLLVLLNYTLIGSTHEKLKDLLEDTKELRSADGTLEEKFEYKDGQLFSNLTVFLPFGQGHQDKFQAFLTKKQKR